MREKREWLIAIRRQLGLSQQEVAVRSFLKRSTYASYETGRRDPEIENAKSVASVLGFDWTIFFTKKCRTKTQKSA